MYPFSQANTIRPIIPNPSIKTVIIIINIYISYIYVVPLPFSSHVMVAAIGEAELSPTPTPFKTACVAKVPVIYEQNAYKYIIQCY